MPLLFLMQGFDLLPPPRFQFDALWLLVDGFSDLLGSKINGFLSVPHLSFGPLDDWHNCSGLLRKFLRGWSRNFSAQDHRDKALLLAQIEALESRADLSGLSESDWDLRFSLECSLVQIHHLNEVYW